MDKVIEIKINGSHLTRDSQTAGVQHEGNATVLRIEFDPGWDGFAKTVTFWNARGEVPVKRVLTADLLEDIKESTRIYLCPIPPEAMTEAGRMSYVIDGMLNSVRQRSVEDRLKVLPACHAPEAGDPADPTPTQAEQLQAQIETITETLRQGIVISDDQKFVPLREEWEDYADAMAEGVASYFCNMAPGTTECVEGTPVQDTPFAAVYCNDYAPTYANLMRYSAVVKNKSTFGHYTAKNWNPIVDGNHDAMELGNGVRYPVMYINCSAFVTLLTKGRTYRDSPWYRLFTDAEVTYRQLAALCLEKGDTDKSTWTFDCLNVLVSWRMMEILRSSGCTPFPFAYKSDEGFITYDAQKTRNLRDGDIIFMGNVSAHPDQYKGIYHTMMYFRTLDRINEKAKAWGDVTLKPFDNQSSAHGYFVHCGLSTDGKAHGTINVIRIETVDSVLERTSNGVTVWGVRAASNSLNSAKLRQTATGRLLLYDCTVVCPDRHNIDAAEDTIPFSRVESRKSDPGAGVFSLGQYRYSQPDSIAGAGDTLDFNDYIGSPNAGVYCMWNSGVHLVNGPTAGNVAPGSAEMKTPTTALFLLEVKCVSGSAAYTVQRISTLTSGQPVVWERSFNYRGEPSLWREICDAARVQEIAGELLEERANIRTYTSLAQLGLTDAGMDPADFAGNIGRICAAAPSGAFSMVPGITSNLTASLAARLLEDTGYSSGYSPRMMIARFGGSNAPVRIDAMFDASDNPHMFTALFDSTSAGALYLRPFIVSYAPSGFLRCDGGEITDDLTIRSSTPRLILSRAGGQEARVSCVNNAAVVQAKAAAESGTYRQLQVRSTAHPNAPAGSMTSALMFYSNEKGESTQTVLHTGNVVAGQTDITAGASADWKQYLVYE